MYLDQSLPIRKLSLHELLNCYREMVRIRHFECVAEEAASAGHIRGMIHSAVGQEAVAVGVCLNLRTTDLIASTHRNHHHALAKGVAADAAMAELLGRISGSCGGKGGSMHIADLSVGMLGANGVVGASVAIIAGAAQALRFQHSDAIAVAFIGDGAINRGQSLEAMNYAAIYRLPVLVVCEDNGWAATTRASTVTAGPGIGYRARALGLKAYEADGNDVEAVASVSEEIVDSLRAGGSPCLLHCRTYRVRGHTCADPAKYRTAGEHEAWLAEDPIPRCRLRLEALGVAHAELDEIDVAERAAMEAALERALASPSPEPSSAFFDIQTAGAAL
jgi:TPP-dependent pyruvate/acetoin dehydrogenase alpha subunit